MAHLGQFDLETARTALPTTKLSGGQRKIPGALYTDDPHNRTFTKNSLIKRLLQEPHYPHKWFVSTDFVYDDDGVETRECLTGQITSYIHQDGKYKWKVKFDDGDILLYECEEIAEMLVTSRRSGLDVTGVAFRN